MTEKLKQIVKREIGKLPEEAQKAINSIDWPKITEEIGKKYLLDESEIDDLRVQTLLVLIGLRDANVYAVNVEYDVGTTEEDAKKISEEVFQKIFTPIINILTENLRKSLQNKKASCKQNLGFVLSGGDYSVFMEQGDRQNSVDETQEKTMLGNSHKIEDLKNKFTI